VSGALEVSIVRQGRLSCVREITCTLGKNDKPFPEAHEASAWTVALVGRGSFRYRSAATNRTHDLRSGWLLFGRPEAVFECSHEHDGGDACISVTVPPEVVLDAARAMCLPASTLLSPSAAWPPAPRVAALVEHLRRRDGDVDELGCFLAEAMLAHVASTPAPMPMPTPTSMSTSTFDVAHHRSHLGRVHDAIDRIEESCSSPLSLTELADAAGFSAFHFLRVFRRVTGATPHQYLIGARLRLALRMLLDTKRSITQVAYDAGFQDLSNFVRTFHRVVGCSPGVYRRSGWARVPARTRELGPTARAKYRRS
jgi:AraC-like DNA-binding protein